MILPPWRTAKLLIAGTISLASLLAAEAPNPALERGFTQNVRPFLAEYCVGCHSGGTPAAQLDLKSFTTVSSVVQDFGH